MMRLLNICVIAALVLAASDVYKIKFESTRQAQRVAKLRTEIRREHDAIAALRAEWAKLDSPARIQDLARRHLPLKPAEPRQSDRLDNLPERPPDLVPVEEPDPIGTMIANPEVLDRQPTGSVPAAKSAQATKYFGHYLMEHRDGVLRDWPRVPLPSDLSALQTSAILEQRIAALLDTETGCRGKAQIGTDCRDRSEARRINILRN